MTRIFYALLPAVFFLFTGGSALAGAAPKLISSHDGWKAYYFMDKNEKVCFMANQPTKQEGKFKKRGEVFFFITRWSGDKDRNVVSISNGYTFKPDSQVSVKVDDKTFKLFTQGGMAWTKDQATDDAMTAAVQKAATLTVKGTSHLGTETTDTYKLKGSAAAYKDVVKECIKKDADKKDPVKKDADKKNSPAADGEKVKNAVH